MRADRDASPLDVEEDESSVFCEGICSVLQIVCRIACPGAYLRRRCINKCHPAIIGLSVEDRFLGVKHGTV